MLPVRRTRRLIVEELADETLVYDQVRHRAHCLNRTAALVWKNCDGRTTIADLAALLGRELGVPVSADVVAAALSALEKARLLENGPALTRRQAAGKMAVAGLAAVVATISAPTAAQAQSLGMCCFSVNDCRGGFNCVGSGHPECARCPTGKCCV